MNIMENQNSQIEELKAKIESLEKKLGGSPELVEEYKAEEKEPIHDIYSWIGPDRILMNKSKSWYVGISFSAISTILIALLFEVYMLIFVVLALIFLIYIVTTLKPIIIEYAVTNRGMRIKDNVYLWSEIKCFWVSEIDGQLTVNVQMSDMKTRYVLIVGNGDVNRIVNEMIKHEEYKEPKTIEFFNIITPAKNKKLTDFANSK